MEPHPPGFVERLAALRARTAADHFDVAAWEAMVAEVEGAAQAHPSPQILAEWRNVYDALLAQFPTAGGRWRRYAEMEMGAGHNQAVKQIFARCLLTNPLPELYHTYIEFIRRMNAQKGVDGLPEIRKAFEYALDRVGADALAGHLWLEYFQFLQRPRAGDLAFAAMFGATMPGQEENNRTVALRRAFQTAICIPTPQLETIWRQYEAWETGQANRQLGYRMLEAQRPRFHAARTVLRERMRRVEGLDRSGMALPPGKGGAAQQAKVQAWKEYVAWELSNPQRLEPALHAARVSLAYDQALMMLPQYPEVWYAYAQWHRESGGGAAAAGAVLSRARLILPSALMLHFTHADLLEESGQASDAQTIYEELVDRMEGMEQSGQVAAKQGGKPRWLSKEHGTLTWIRYMHFMRRKDGEAAARKVFLRARKWPKSGWQVYVASAMMEFRFLPTKEDTKVPRNIFELGLANYLTEPAYVLQYADFLLSLGDLDNLRALLERALAVTPASAAAPLYDRYITIEYANGDLATVAALEGRRREAVPPSPSDDMHLLLLKYRELDLWPCSPMQRQHLERLMGVAPADTAVLLPQTPARSPYPVGDAGQGTWPPPSDPHTAHMPSPGPNAGPSPAYGMPTPTHSLQLPPDIVALLGALPPPQALTGTREGEVIRTQVVAMVVDALMKAEISNGGIKGSRTGAWSRMGPRHNSNHAGANGNKRRLEGLDAEDDDLLELDGEYDLYQERRRQRSRMGAT